MGTPMLAEAVNHAVLPTLGILTPNIYLDHASTTPVDAEVVKTMNRVLAGDGNFGNPASTTHGFGERASEIIETAREQVASLLGATPEEIVWTSGATESINLVLQGLARARGTDTRILTSPLEHKATLDTLKWLQDNGVKVDFVELEEDGSVTADAVSDALRPNTSLVTLMHVNNETGAITDVGEIGKRVAYSDALFHVDAAQSLARLPVRDILPHINFLSFSAHKAYGPKGVGALYVSRESRDTLSPLLFGGGHEAGLRSGTLPTHQIAGFGTAAAIVASRLPEDAEFLNSLDRNLIEGLLSAEGVELNGSVQDRVNGLVNIHVAAVEAEAMMVALKGVAISTGSACTSAHITPSHVLLSLGYDEQRAMSSLRFSAGRNTTMEEIEYTVSLFQEAIPALRGLSA